MKTKVFLDALSHLQVHHSIIIVLHTSLKLAFNHDSKLTIA